VDNPFEINYYNVDIPKMKKTRYSPEDKKRVVYESLKVSQKPELFLFSYLVLYPLVITDNFVAGSAAGKLKKRKFVVEFIRTINEFNP